ncbi:hypothetical protein LOTGIDRAFT_235797 [Lottia gigantea]|uniref:EF-hand domain-containing protein n=1 Tax=Lottia gigantea TaxID=225164 RepID=V4B8X3_LOTGI|nr:hypothetical protein LOTGIDRAFT_235797 [Lottia gigantea]ESO85289.1 hypothetical protein LOTGIDRAFT_235797 [Lottia gigantea]
MWFTNLLLCLLFAYSTGSTFPNLFHTGRVEEISLRFADRNSNTKIEADEFQREIMKYDTNYDGKLSQSELSNCIIPWSFFQSNGDVTDVQPAFIAMDKNTLLPTSLTGGNWVEKSEDDGSLSFQEARNPY